MLNCDTPGRFSAWSIVTLMEGSVHGQLSHSWKVQCMVNCHTHGIPRILAYEAGAQMLCNENIAASWLIYDAKRPITSRPRERGRRTKPWPQHTYRIMISETRLFAEQSNRTTSLSRWRAGRKMIMTHDACASAFMCDLRTSPFVQAQQGEYVCMCTCTNISSC
jgi:hypothetical protein